MSNQRWAVELQGEQFDLDDVRKLLVSGPFRASHLEINGIKYTALFADELEHLKASGDVAEAARHIVDLVNGVLFLHDTARSPLAIGKVFERTPSGWQPIVHLAANFVCIDRMRAQISVSTGGRPQHTSPQELEWLQLADQDDVVADILTFLKGKPDWFELYKAFERGITSTKFLGNIARRRSVGQINLASTNSHKAQTSIGTRPRNGITFTRKTRQ